MKYLKIFEYIKFNETIKKSLSKNIQEEGNGNGLKFWGKLEEKNPLLYNFLKTEEGENANKAFKMGFDD